MKEVLLAIAEELVLFSPEEARQVLGRLSRSDSALEACVERLVGEGALLPLEAEESVLRRPALLRWNSEQADAPEVRDAVAALGLPKRSYADVNWDALTGRLLGALEEEAKVLEGDVVELARPPRQLELRYFDLSIEYHRHYSKLLRLSFTEELSGAIPLKRWEEFRATLSRLRELLDRLDYR